MHTVKTDCFMDLTTLSKLANELGQLLTLSLPVFLLHQQVARLTDPVLGFPEPLEAIPILGVCRVCQ